MVYLEGKLQSCLKLRNVQNPLNKDKSVDLKFELVVELAKLNFTYKHSTKIAKAGPGFDKIPLKL
jgi:hypothetical protein